jgi:RNA polymerase sigma factor (sigma-70 family)
MDTARQITTPAPWPLRRRASILSVVNLHQGRGSMPTSDELSELVKAVAATGDRQAFAVLFKHFAPRIKAFLARAGSPDNLAEELAQETMVCVWRKAAQFDADRARVSTWIFTIARNLRVDHHRRRGESGADLAWSSEGSAEERDDAYSREEQLPDPAASPDEQLATVRREMVVRQALNRLSQDHVTILRLSFFEDRPHSQIARELGIPLGTVKSRIRLAVNHLRRLLDGHEP